MCPQAGLDPTQATKMFKNTFQSGFLSILYSIGSKPLQIWDKQGADHLCRAGRQPAMQPLHAILVPTRDETKAPFKASVLLHKPSAHCLPAMLVPAFHPELGRHSSLICRPADCSCTSSDPSCKASHLSPVPAPAAVRNGHIKRLTDGDIQSSVLEVMSTNVSTTYITCPADPDKTLGIKLPFLVMIIKNLKKYFSFEVQVLDDKNVRRRFRASNYQVRAATALAIQQPVSIKQWRACGSSCVCSSPAACAEALPTSGTTAGCRHATWSP